MKTIALLLLLAAVFLAFRLVMPSVGSKAVAGVKVKDGKSSLADCPDTPNCQCSEASRQSQRVARLAISQNPANSIATLASIIEGMPGMTIVQSDEKYLYATATTRIMQYVDDIEFLLDEDTKSIQVRSASRLGRSDFGANAKRIDAIRASAEGRL